MVTMRTNVYPDVIDVYGKTVQTRIKAEESQYKAIQQMLDDALKRIKKVTQSKTGEAEYISFALVKFLEEYGISSKSKELKTRVLYSLRGSKNIVTRLGEADKGRVVPDNMKPFAYSFVSEEQKKKMGLDAYCMKNLSKDMMAYIEMRCKKIGAKSDIYDLLLICDYLMSHEADKKWIKLMGMKLSANLGQPILRTNKALGELMAANILLTGQVKRSTRGEVTICRLAWNIKAYSELNNQLMSGEAGKQFLSGNAADVVISPSVIENLVEARSQEYSAKKVEKITKNLENNRDGKGLGLFSQNSLTGDFADDRMGKKSQDETVVPKGPITPRTKREQELVRRLDSVKRYLQSAMKGEEKQRKAAETLREFSTALQEENAELRSKLAKTESELNKMKNRLAVQEDFNRAYAAEARKAMNMLISNASTTTEKFTQIPAKRVTPDDVAEFKNGILSAIGDAQNRLRDFTYSKVVPLKD